MDVDPQVLQLGTQLADVTLRNGASAISDRIRTAKASRDDRRTIGELEEIVNQLLEDRAELIRISESYKEYVSAQEISEDDLDFISENLVPRIAELAQATGTDASQLEDVISVLEPLLATETIKVAQLFGFNFRRAFGEPLTELMATWIALQAPTKVDDAEVQRLQLQREVLFLELVKDDEAVQRWRSLTASD